jgi:diguanylate cyclase (GGDEF)-like protein
MRMTSGSETKDMDFADRLKVAQARIMLANITMTLIGNLFIASSIAIILGAEGGGRPVSLWLTLVLVLGCIRCATSYYLYRSKLYQTQPAKTLHIMVFLALLSGLSWTPVPLFLANLNSSSSSGYIVFVLAGTTAGAIIQNLAYWRAAIAFAAPLLAATLLMLVMQGRGIDYLIATNLLLLTVMLFRASIHGQNAFVASRITAMRAVELADSLASANSEIVQSNRQLEYVANTDALTGLANRSVFNRRMAALFGGAGPVPEAALVLMDLDKFKVINDTRGHKAGDAVLQEAAARLLSVCGAGDLALRLGGDEFAVLLTGEDAGARACGMSKKFVDLLLEPITVAGQSIQVSSSVGIARLPGDADNAADFYSCADMALYDAKEQGHRGIKHFDSALKARLEFQRCLDRDLESAIDTGQIEVHFQPQVTLGKAEATGFEALIRWKHPEIGYVSPPEIVSAAANLRLSEKLTRHVCEASCKFIKRLDAAGHDNLLVSINVSPTDFAVYSPAEMLIEIAGAYQVSPERMEVEITEEAILDPRKVGLELGLISQAGFKLAVDDFGMGHSSLAHLMSLKIDRLKVDRSFVADISGSTHNQALVAALVSVGRSLGMDLVMEGVETAEDAETLRMLGCRIGQGWLYGKAMPENEALNWLTDASRTLRRSA